MFASNTDGISYIIADATITYENGAKVNTSFVTNIETNKFIRTAPTLRLSIIDANKDANKKNKSLPKYEYPNNVVSSALLSKISNVDFSIQRNECSFVRSLENQRKQKKVIFGGGYFINNTAAAKFETAKPVQVWELTERERQIIKKLN